MFSFPKGHPPVPMSSLQVVTDTEIGFPFELDVGIKNRTHSTRFYHDSQWWNYTWFGSLDTLVPDDAYRITLISRDDSFLGVVLFVIVPVSDTESPQDTFEVTYGSTRFPYEGKYASPSFFYFSNPLNCDVNFTAVAQRSQIDAYFSLRYSSDPFANNTFLDTAAAFSWNFYGDRSIVAPSSMKQLIPFQAYVLMVATNKVTFLFNAQDCLPPAPPPPPTLFRLSDLCDIQAYSNEDKTLQYHGLVPPELVHRVAYVEMLVNNETLSCSKIEEDRFVLPTTLQSSSVAEYSGRALQEGQGGTLVADELKVIIYLHPSPPSPPSQPPFGCTLDFLSFEYASDYASVGPDGFLTLEFAEMERFAHASALQQTANSYWCELQRRPELVCLDIAAPSTLSNSLNVGSQSGTVFDDGTLIEKLYETANFTEVNLFGQYDTCDGKVVGDGLINVFDIATLMSYLFSDYSYGNLNPNPDQVSTVSGRTGILEQCFSQISIQEYMQKYVADTCLKLNQEDAIIASWNSRRTLQDAEYSETESNSEASGPVQLVLSASFAEGEWYTLLVDSVHLRSHVSFTGLSFQESTKLDLQVYDGLPPEDPSQRLVKYTRLCEEQESCRQQCAIIESAHSSMVAMVGDVLELYQNDVEAACQYYVRLWVPLLNTTSRNCVGISYAAFSDGKRGTHFQGSNSCARSLFPHPSLPPSYPKTPSLPSAHPPLTDLLSPPASPSEWPHPPRLHLVLISMVSFLAASLFAVGYISARRPIQFSKRKEESKFVQDNETPKV